MGVNVAERVSYADKLGTEHCSIVIGSCTFGAYQITGSFPELKVATERENIEPLRTRDVHR